MPRPSIVFVLLTLVAVPVAPAEEAYRAILFTSSHASVTSLERDLESLGVHVGARFPEVGLWEIASPRDLTLDRIRRLPGVLDGLAERDAPAFRHLSKVAGEACCALGPEDTRTLANTSGSSARPLVIAGAGRWSETDVETFNLEWGLGPLPAGSEQVCAAPSSPTGCAAAGLEATLDVEIAHATDPTTPIVNVMAASTNAVDFAIMYASVATRGGPSVVSSSWGICEGELAPAALRGLDAIIQAGVHRGQTWLAASGDAGSATCPSGTLFPASSPHTIGVGGVSPTCTMTEESTACAPSSFWGWPGSGGGVSDVFVRPPWQDGCGVWGTRRAVPDLAFVGDPTPGFYVRWNGAWLAVGGTSAATPVVAQVLAQIPGADGLMTPRLYQLCGTNAVRDVRLGHVLSRVTPGYDTSSGLGVPDASELVATYFG